MLFRVFSRYRRVDCILHGRRKRNPVGRLIHGARLLDVTLRLALSFSHKNTPINTARYFREEEIPADIRA